MRRKLEKFKPEPSNYIKCENRRNRAVNLLKTGKSVSDVAKTLNEKYIDVFYINKRYVN